MTIYIKLICLRALSIFALCAIISSSAHGLPDDGIQKISKIKYLPVFEKQLKGEISESGQSSLAVHAFDLKRNNGRNGIVVCGKNIYIFSARGTILYQSEAAVFKEGASRIRVAKLAKDGYYDNLIVSGGGEIKVFDSLAIHLATLKAEYFLNKDLNGDGVDELIVNRGAYYTNNNGLSWKPLWLNPGVRSMQDIADVEGGGFCYNHYIQTVSSVDKDGRMLFTPKAIDHIRCLTTGDFDGDGIKDDIAAPSGSGTIHILDHKTGNTKNTIEMKISGEIIDLNEVMTIETGRLSSYSSQDDIVIGGRRGIVACDALGNILWSYIKWPGQNATPPVYNLFITDLNGDGQAEVVAGKGDEIFIFTNNGTLLDKLTVKGILSRWQHRNALMDIADIDNDGNQEILAVTSEGWFYIFSMSGQKQSS